MAAKKRRQQEGFPLRPELIVIARREADVRATREGLAEAAAADVDPVNKVLRDAKATIEPLFGASEERLRLATAEPTPTGEEPPDLSVFYSVNVQDDLESVAQALLDSDAVEAAYVVPPAEPAEGEDDEGINEMAAADEDAPPATADFSGRQGYLDRAPGGIDARYAWTVPGGERGRRRHHRHRRGVALHPRGPTPEPGRCHRRHAARPTLAGATTARR